MSLKKIKYIIIFALAILALVFFYYNKSKNKQIDWYENYNENSKQPYGTYLIYEITKQHYVNHDFNIIESKISDNLTSSKTNNSNYIFIGQRLLLDSVSTSTLLDFAENGNNVFISAKDFPPHLIKALIKTVQNCSTDLNELNITHYFTTYAPVYLNLLHPGLKLSKDIEFQFLQDGKAGIYSWSFFNNDIFCDYNVKVSSEKFLKIGTIDNVTNFVKVKYGEGNFYLHTTPQAFANLHMNELYGLTYFEQVFAHLNEGDIYWDAYSHSSYSSNNSNYSDDDKYFEPVSLSENSPIEYVLSQKSLRWAWFLLLILGLLFLMFRAKRRQKVIPVQEPNLNTSLEFIESIGQLYFQLNNHQKLEEQKMKLFLRFIRERYKIAVQNIDDELIRNLSVVSGINEKKVKAIFALYEGHSKKTNIYVEQLIHFHQAMDHFYKNCK